MLRLLFSYLLCFSKAQVRVAAICSMFSLVFEVVPALVCLLALLQTIRILLAPEKTIEEQLLVSISALRVLWQPVMHATTRSGFDLISLIIAWGRRAENCLEASLSSLFSLAASKYCCFFLEFFCLLGTLSCPVSKGLPCLVQYL